MTLINELKDNWTNIEVLATGDQYFAELLQSFRKAQKHIQIEVYIFNIDSITRALLEELVRARARGVRVQILVDGFGSYQSTPDLLGYCARHDLELKIYEPFPFSQRTHRKIFFAYALSLFHLLRKLNRRNHRKMVVVDHRQAFVGSMNWTQVHSRKAHGVKAWRDTAVRIEGHEVELLSHAFILDWNRALKIGDTRFRKKSPLLKYYDPRKSLVRLNTGLKERWRLNRDLLRRIRHAEHRVWLTTAYFLPHRSLMRALKKAARRGVSVIILVPGTSDVPLVKWAALELAHNLSLAGVKIFEYQTSILHAKVMRIDNWVTVGSANLNYRSVFHDLEVEVVLNDAKSLELIQQQWDSDLKNSLPFDVEEYRSASWFQRILSRIAFRLRYLL